jgi:hypothetical protein
MSDAAFEQLVIHVVRGQTEWTALKRFIYICRREEGWDFDAPPGLSVRVCAEDIREGYRFLSAEADVERLRTWASFLLAFTVVDFSGFDESPESNALLELLWNKALE